MMIKCITINVFFHMTVFCRQSEQFQNLMRFRLDLHASCKYLQLRTIFSLKASNQLSDASFFFFLKEFNFKIYIFLKNDNMIQKILFFFSNK